MPQANLIRTTADDPSFGDRCCYGQGTNPTPTIDWLAAAAQPEIYAVGSNRAWSPHIASRQTGMVRRIEEFMKTARSGSLEFPARKQINRVRLLDIP